MSYEQLSIDFTPREIGRACADACLRNAEEIDKLDTEGAKAFIVSQVVRHGPMSGEDLVDAAIAHGFRCKEMRAYGGVFQSLTSPKSGKLMVLRSDLPRKRGHGTTGGKLYGLVR